MLRPVARRWTRQEFQAHLASAPRFFHDAPTRDRLDALEAWYTRLTGEPGGRAGRRNLLAAGHRVHGPDYEAFVADRFHETGTTTNLLGEVRCASPRTSRLAAPSSMPSVASSWRVDRVALDCGCPVGRLLPLLVYCEGHRPPFDPTDAWRHDRRSSNPEAVRFFSREAPLGSRGGGNS